MDEWMGGCVALRTGHSLKGLSPNNNFILTSLCFPFRLAVPPLAQSTGTFMAVPANATALADWPSPITMMPASGRFSVCWQNIVNTFEENLNEKK